MAFEYRGQDIVTLWKDGEPDILALPQATAEYAKLRNDLLVQPVRPTFTRASTVQRLPSQSI